MFHIPKNWHYFLPVLLAHFVYTGYQIWAGNFYVPEDSYEYVRAAETLRNGEEFCIGGAECKYCDTTQSKSCTASDYSYRTPGYPLFLVPGLTAGNLEIISIIFQNTLAFFCFRALFLFIQKRKRHTDKNDMPGWKKIFYSDWSLVVLLLLCPTHFIYCNFILSETLLECVLLLFVLETLKYEEEKSATRLWYATILFSIALFIKPVVSILVVPVLIYFLSQKEVRKNPVSVVISFLPLLILLSWSYRNYSKTGKFEYSSVSTHNLVSYHVYLTAIHSGDQPDSVVHEIYRAANVKTTYPEQQHIVSSLSREYLWQHKYQWLKIFSKGIVIMMFDPGRFETDFFLNGSTAVGGKYMELFHREGVSAVLRDVWNHYGILLAVFLITPLLNLYLLVMTIQFLRNKEISMSARILIFLIIAGIFVATGPLGASRFRLPLTLVVLLAASLQRVAAPHLRN